MSSKAIYALLVDETDADDRIYAVTVPQRNGQAYPVIVFQQVNGTPMQSTNGGSPTKNTIWQLTAIGTTHAQAEDALEQARTILHGYSGTVAGVVVHHITTEDGSERDIPYDAGDMEQLERFGKSLDFRIMYDGTTPTN